MIVVGCSSEGKSLQTPTNSEAATSPTVNKQKTSTENEHLAIINDAVVQKYGQDIKDFNVHELTDVDGATFGNYIFEKDGVPHEGVVYGTTMNSKLSVQQLEAFKTDTKVPVTIMEVAGVMKEQGNRNYRIFSGVLHDDRIRAIRIEYGGSIGTALIKVGDNQKMFLDVQVGFSGGIKSFAALDANNKVIFERK